jgi:hypothetical protein
MTGYLVFPKEESGYDLAVRHPAINAWLQRIAALPGWQAPYGHRQVNGGWSIKSKQVRLAG